MNTARLVDTFFKIEKFSDSCKYFFVELSIFVFLSLLLLIFFSLPDVPLQVGSRPTYMTDSETKMDLFVMED